MKKLHILTLAIAAALVSTLALAQTAAPRTHAKPDANGDGVITKEEAAKFPRLAERFAQLDKNKDGKLAGDEMPRRGQRGPGGHPFAELDKDKDGRVSKAEAAADPKFAERFAKMDANQDGFVDKADRELAGKQHRDDWFESADSNNDGSLSKAEYDAAHAKRNGEGHKHGRWGRGAPPAKDAAAQ